MDFFQAQDNALKRSKWLLVWFLLAVTLIVVALYLAFSGIAFLVVQESGVSLPQEFRFWSLPRMIWIGLLGVGLMGIASISKIMQMRQGGAAVARLLGGRRVDPSPSDPGERRLMNVVEEMSIASGVPLPEVFVMDEEPGINAFAAGFSPNDAAIGVTRGCLEQLTRDELQGVIAHEFSHILNGDMRLNIKLAGILFGILVLAIIGRTILFSMRFSRVGGGGRGRGGGGAVVVILLSAAALLAIGSIGLLFGRLIQAAISRQREFLADAAAVQFTRNPPGLVGAFRKIGGLIEHGKVSHGQAVGFAHAFFMNIGSRASSFASFSTHPPLADRIRAIDPSSRVGATSTPADGSAIQEEIRLRRERGLQEKPEAGAKKPAPAPSARERFRVSPAAMVAAVGVLGAEQIEQAQRVIRALPPELQQARNDTGSARAVVLALVFDPDPESLQRQLARVKEEAAPETAAAISRFAPVIRDLPDALRLPALEWVLPGLYGLTPEAYDRFSRVLDACIRSDGVVDFSEFVLQRLVKHQLEPRVLGRDVGEVPVRYHSVVPLKKEFEVILTFVARKCGADPADCRSRFERLREAFPELPALEMPSGSDALHTEDLGKALDRLAQADFGIRRQLLEAALQIVTEDGSVSAQEAELVRILAISLDCPVAPLSASNALET